MSQAKWYPEESKERRQFFLRTFPLFVILAIFFYFGLDWLGAFEFLEYLVRDNSSWLMKIIYGLEPLELGDYQRVDEDLLSGGVIETGLYFPGIMLPGYSRKLIIIRACTGMEAGALLMALIFVTPAKWENKAVAQVVNLLMMHIGNTFRIAFHFWFTRYLHVNVGLSEGQAFYYAHDLLSKVFGFIGIIIFTLVIERIDVKIVSTFGAWLDTIGEGISRLTPKIQNMASFTVSNSSSNTEIAGSSADNPAQLVAFPTIIGQTLTLRVEELSENESKINFYPIDQIKKDKWSFFKKTFGSFLVVSIGVLLLGLIPPISRGIALASDSIASNWFGATIESFSKNTLFWKTKYLGLNEVFVTNLFTSVGLLAFLVGLIVATPAEWRKKIWGIGITILLVVLWTIFYLAFEKWTLWSIANNIAMKTNKPMLYINLQEYIPGLLTFGYWFIGFITPLFVYHQLDLKVFPLIYAWLHQIIYYLGGVLGLREKEEEQLQEKTKEFNDVHKEKEARKDLEAKVPADKTTSVEK
ncbi:MAG: hypothetical protein GF308_03760 [Candidatus Heimdallarchaeota archaeon]|nr:hypothetical protein [Candidatus Heimdallarchaeota archaeon]